MFSGSSYTHSTPTVYKPDHTSNTTPALGVPDIAYSERS